MDQAKAAADKILHRSGHHDTTVHENVAPAVTHETVNKQHHENVQKAVDRETHQDHFHTTVQPVQDREVLPEQHTHRHGTAEHHEHHHGKDHAIAESLKQERAHFHDKSIQGTTSETSSALPTVTGEHRHHHVHETIQPVVQKETVQPSVVHTTIPVHEVHHNDPKHHAASALPAVSMADFKKQGGALTGRQERSDAFEGEPNTLASTGTASAHSSGSRGNNSGPHNSGVLNKLDPRVDSDRDGSSNAGMTKTSAPMGGSSTSGAGLGSTGTTGTHGTSHTGSGIGAGSNTSTLGSTGTSSGTGLGSGVSGTHGSTNAGPHNSNLANKADPRVDSDLDRSRNAGLNSSTGNSGYSTSGTGLGNTTGTHSNTTAGPHSSNLANKADPRIDSDLDGSSGLNRSTGTTGTTGTTGASGTTGTSGYSNTGTGLGSGTTHGTTHDTTHDTTGTTKKTSLLDKLNPRKDADGDGKAGFFS